MFKLATLLSIAAVALADKTFTLTAKGDGIDAPVGASGDQILIGAAASTFKLEEPSGYVDVAGKRLIINPPGTLGLDSGNGSKDFGVDGGQLTFHVAGTEFYACEGNTIGSYECEGGKKIQLIVNEGEAPASSAPASSAPASSAPASSAPASSAPASSAPVSSAPASSAAPTTHTSAAPSSAHTSAVPSVETATNGAARLGAGLAGLSGLALLL